MKYKARHLQILEDMRINNYKAKKTKANSLREIIKNARDDEFKKVANAYAISLGLPPPNVLSYEK